MKTFFALVLFLMTAGGVCWAQSDSQSLADVARQNRQNKQPAHVIDQDDIGRGTISVVGNESAQAAAPAADAPGKAVADNGKNGKATPSANNPQVAELKKKLDSYKAEQQSWKNSAKRYQDLLANETDDFRRKTYQDALDNDTGNVATFQKKIDQTQADLARAQAADSQSSAARAPSAGGSTPSNNQQ